MNYSKIVYFLNWAKKDFTAKFDSKETTLKAGKTYQMPIEMAEHFANHLANRELMDSGDVRDEALPQAKHKLYMDRCFPSGSIDSLERNELPIKEVEDTPATPSAPEVEKDVRQEEEEKEEEVRDNKLPKPKKTSKKTTDDEYQKTA